MPTIINETEDDIDYEMDGGRPDPEGEPIFAGRIAAGTSVTVPPGPIGSPVVNHRFFSVRPQVPPQKKTLATILEVPKEVDVSFGYSCTAKPGQPAPDA